MAEYLVAYDYCMGGVWAVVRADSAAAILREYPEVVVQDEPPEWMDEVQLTELRTEAIVLVPGVHEGMFSAIVDARDNDGPDRHD